MKRIPLSATRGTPKAYALVDDADFEQFGGFAWSWLNPRGYAIRVVSGRHLLLHREICVPGPGMVVDHINGNALDNRRENLRVVTRAENNRNRRPTVGTSQYRGVHWASRERRWRARAEFEGRVFHLGFFADEEAAARAVVDFWSEADPFAFASHTTQKGGPGWSPDRQ